MSVLPGFVIKRYATLHLKCLGLVVLFYFSTQKQNASFSRAGSLILGGVLGYWHALYWMEMETWLGQQALRTGAAHCEPPESAASPSHQLFLKGYSHVAPVLRSLLRSDRATGCSSADRYRIHLDRVTHCSNFWERRTGKLPRNPKNYETRQTFIQKTSCSDRTKPERENEWVIAVRFQDYHNRSCDPPSWHNLSSYRSRKCLAQGHTAVINRQRDSNQRQSSHKRSSLT